jgi:hypothetical protein
MCFFARRRRPRRRRWRNIPLDECVSMSYISPMLNRRLDRRSKLNRPSKDRQAAIAGRAARHAPPEMAQSLKAREGLPEPPDASRTSPGALISPAPPAQRRSRCPSSPGNPSVLPPTAGASPANHNTRIKWACERKEGGKVRKRNPLARPNNPAGCQNNFLSQQPETRPRSFAISAPFLHRFCLTFRSVLLTILSLSTTSSFTLSRWCNSPQHKVL